MERQYIILAIFANINRENNFILLNMYRMYVNLDEY